MPFAIISLTTDFGIGSPYVAQMKGIILSILPEATLVDLTHAIGPQDIRAGALALADASVRFPAGSIHVAVVDPDVGTVRNIVAAEIDGRYYVAPDNGLLSLVAQQAVEVRCVSVSEPRYWLPRVSKTFHGRDIMAPVAAHIGRGVPIQALGRPQTDWVSLEWPAAQHVAGTIHGQIIAVDSFGNLISNITADDLAALHNEKSLVICCGQSCICGVVETYGHRSPGSTVALIGSGGRLEIAVVGGNAARELKIETGQTVTVGVP